MKSSVRLHMLLLALLVFAAGGCSSSAGLAASRAGLLSKRDAVFLPKYEELNQIRNRIQIQGRALNAEEEGFLERMQKLDEQFYGWENGIYTLEKEGLKGRSAKKKVKSLEEEFSKLMEATEAMFHGFPFE